MKRSEILTRIWGKDDYFLGRSVDVFITRLRKLFKDEEGVTIQSLRGTGFILKTPEI